VSGDLELLLAAAREAGELALTYYQRDPRVWPKGTSVVSEADLALDRLLTERLRAARPDYGWLSEETADEPARLGVTRIFVVDPIDGTRSFLEGGREWTISLAVVEAGRPVAAALFAPVLDQMHVAERGAGARRNGVRLAVSNRADLAGARLAGPRRYIRPLAASAGMPGSAIRFVPSLAYRVALVAAGELDVAIADIGSHDWDVAAADLLVHEAGGTMTDFSGRTIRYNAPEPRHPPLIAANDRLRSSAMAMAEAVDGRVE
jgi:myo-inositol-1(or 4)-monophosphatase